MRNHQWIYAACVLLAPPAIADVPTYQVKDIGTLGGRFTEVIGVNDLGEVAGYSETVDGQLHAFVYSDGELTDLGTLGGPGSVGRAINNGGQVSGFSLTSAGEAHAFLYADGLMSDLGTLGGASVGNAVNRAGEVAGQSTKTDGLSHAVLFSEGKVNDLGSMGGTDSTAMAINAKGEIAGTFDDGSGTHAFFLRGKKFDDMVPGRASFLSGPTAMNDDGLVIGGFDQAGLTRCFLYKNEATDIGTLGGDYCVGLAINRAGRSTGIAARADGERHAFLYADKTMSDLGTLGGTMSVGYALNDRDQVAGSSSIASGVMHAFVTADGTLVDLGQIIDQISSAPVIESVALAVSATGQVVGRYTVSDPSDAQMPTKNRGFVATPSTVASVLSLLTSLISDVTSLGLLNNLLGDVLAAQTSYLLGDQKSTCKKLKSFGHEVNEQDGKKIEHDKALQLIQQAGLIRTALLCT